MKRLILVFTVTIVTAFSASAQSSISEEPTDSISLKADSRSITTLKIVEGLGRYKVIPTTNSYNSLKLDTATGEVTALQIGLPDVCRMEYLVSGSILNCDEDIVVGRFDLYPTDNVHNFILMDSISGNAYQVQWSTNSTECGCWRIYQEAIIQAADAVYRDATLKEAQPIADEYYALSNELEAIDKEISISSKDGHKLDALRAKKRDIKLQMNKLSCLYLNKTHENIPVRKQSNTN